MKIKRLEISNFRGIKNLALDLDYMNAVVWGPNGSGKSAVVDAIDFVLTGKILRLEGEATRAVALGKHGPHIDHVGSPRSATVTACVSIPGTEDEVVISRNVGSPDQLEVHGADGSVVQDITDLASTGQHSLSRREILKYIAAPDGKRSSEVQRILGLDNLESTRKALGKASRQATDRFKRAEMALKSQEQRLQTNLDLDEFSPEGVLSTANTHRKQLGAKPLDRIAPAATKRGCQNPGTSNGKDRVNPQLLEKATKAVQNVSADEVKKLSVVDKKLRQLVEAILADTSAITADKRIQILEAGIEMLDESGECPLCGHIWTPEELETTLSGRLDKARTNAPMLEKISSFAQTITLELTKRRDSLTEVLEATERLDMPSEGTIVRKRIETLDSLEKCCASPIETYLDSDVNFDTVFGEDTELFDACKATLKKASENSPKTSPEQTAWDTLTKMETLLPEYLSATLEINIATAVKSKAETLNKSFKEARETKLNTLYDSIKDRFTDLYRFLHADDEGEFSATLSATGKFTVDFYGRGQHPPLALHSEGHQDSMGLCLYLALAERLTAGKCRLTVLDDVVMSVDATHRRQACIMLKEFFPDRQFLITTHDRTWAGQLRSEGIATRARTFQFYRWSVDTGPSLVFDTDLWSNIEKDFQQDDVSAAAARLRRGAESFFECLCDRLGAAVRYKTSGLWELGDFMSGARHEMKKLIGKAKAAESVYNRPGIIDSICDFDRKWKDIVKRTGSEQWAVNAAVHYNNWHALEAEDLKPIVAAFLECFTLLWCNRCDSLLRVSFLDGEPTTLSCSCGTFLWNLRTQKR